MASSPPTGPCWTGRERPGPADVALVGDEATVEAQLADLADAGVTDFVAGEFGRGEDAVRTRRLLTSLLQT